MTIRTLSPNVSVSPQLSVEEAATAADKGFRSIIGTRPDGEGPGQPRWTEIENAARGAGLEARHIPVAPSRIDEASVAAFAEALETMPKPVLVYCGTGGRSTILWALSNNGSLTADERIRAATRAGFDLEPHRARMAGGD